MAKLERMRESTSEILNLENLKNRMSAGWRLVALEWERETVLDQHEPETSGTMRRETLADPFAEEIPYGVQVSADGRRLEKNPEEYRVLVALMELLVQDLPLSQVAQDMNRLGMRTRSGHLWTQLSVFEMLPRLTEVSPKILSDKEWETRRRKLRQTPEGLRAVQ